MKHLKRLIFGSVLTLGIGSILVLVISLWAAYPITFLLSLFLPLSYGLGKALLDRNPEL